MIDLAERAGASVDPDPDTVAAATAGLPLVLVGRGPAAEPGITRLFDVVVDDPGPVVETVERCPLASVTLALVLRATTQLDVPSGLAAESAAYSTVQAGPEFRRWRASRPARHPVPDNRPAVLVDRGGDSVLALTLNRPHVHNAFSTSMRDGLAEGLLLAASDSSVERVMLSGAGPSFCSGGDLDEFGTFGDPACAHLVRLTRSPAALLARLSSRTRVDIHGATMGAGIELAAFAGRVVAHPDTVIALPEVGLGLIPGAGGTVSVPRRIGRQRTAELALSGRHLDAPTALSWGLVDEISPP
ncbi:MAG: enoyl-CoA hydratase/isomerase family protein [Acidimicrobiia bacterium]